MVVKPEIETFQNPWELDLLVAAVQYHEPGRVLEIGAWHGGTLWHWLGIAGEVVVVDDRMRLAGEWRRWAFGMNHFPTLRLVQGMSDQGEVIEEAAEYGPYDFIFIDGDHTYESVRADWDNYSPMVAEGGLIALHDILPRPGYGVSTLWEQIKALPGTRWVEICHNEVLPGNEGRCGIGIVFV